MNDEGTGYDFMPFDDDDDDEEASVATMLEFDEEFDPSTADDDDDDDEDGSDIYDDDDDDEEFFGALGTLLNPGASIIKGIGSLFKGSSRNKRRVSMRRAPNRGVAIRGRRGRATIMTRRGPVSARLQTRMVTPAELRIALAGVSRDLRSVRTGVVRVDRNAIKRDSATRKRSAQLLSAERKERRKLSKRIKDMQQQSLMMSLLKGDPQIQTLTGTIDTAAGTMTVNENGTVYRDSDDLFLMMMMMGGGFGGSGGSGDMNQMMMMMMMMDKL